MTEEVARLNAKEVERKRLAEEAAKVQADKKAEKKIEDTGEAKMKTENEILEEKKKTPEELKVIQAAALVKSNRAA